MMGVTDEMDEYLGSGWRYPVGLADGRAKLSRGEEAVRQSIWLILSTAPGERVMRPEFGCGIHNLLFAVNNATTRGQAAAAVQRALARWEPRIDVLEVRVTTEPNQPATLLVHIDYRVRRTHHVDNLVYPFYLEGGAS